jgi:predicted RNA binding protein YcfA (HicA-like mRNA interferase family)
MTQRLPRITADELIRALGRDGWVEVKPGKHRHYRHPTKSGRVDVAYHVGRIIPPRTLLSILNQAGLTVDQLRDLL